MIYSVDIIQVLLVVAVVTMEKAVEQYIFGKCVALALKEALLAVTTSMTLSQLVIHRMWELNVRKVSDFYNYCAFNDFRSAFYVGLYIEHKIMLVFLLSVVTHNIIILLFTQTSGR